MQAIPDFGLSLTAFQRRALGLLLGQGFPEAVIVQVPYQHPIPGDANQYVTVDWPGVVKVWLYDDEVQVGELTFERHDYPTDEQQFDALVEEVTEAFSATR